MAVSERDGELIAHQVSKLQVVVAVLKVSYSSIEQCLVEGLHALRCLAPDTDPLNSACSSIFCACKAETLGTTVELTS